MIQNISDIINVPNNYSKIGKIYGKCENKKMSIFHFSARNICQKCHSIVCNYCIGKSGKICAICTRNSDNEYCNLCDKIYVSTICFECDEIIKVCQFKCNKNKFDFSGKGRIVCFECYQKLTLKI